MEAPDAPHRWRAANPVDDARRRPARLLARLRQAGHQPVAFAELHAGGIDFPAAVVSELELNGYVNERVYDHGRLVGVRLLDPEPPDTSAADRRRRRPMAAPIASRSALAITADGPAQ